MEIKISNKKAVALGINTIIIITIAVVVMVVVIGFFFGGFTRIGGGAGAIGEEVATGAEESGVGEKIGEIEGIWGGGCSEGSYKCCKSGTFGSYTYDWKRGTTCPTGWESQTDHKKCGGCGTGVDQLCEDCSSGTWDSYTCTCTK